jgi:integrase/recombinase XerC
LRWVQKASPKHFGRRARRLEVVRQFALFWKAFDSRTQIPPAGLFGPSHRRVPVHIYTPEEISALLTTASQCPSLRPSNPSPYVTLFGLLACTGLRISEALELRLEDWDPQSTVLTIRQTKSGQSRYVPVSSSVARALNEYRQLRSKTFASPVSAQFFLNEHGRLLRYPQVSKTFSAIRRQLGWHSQVPCPRLHDLRHTFAVTVLLGWYRQGQREINAKILSLAVYLGHRNIRHTYWYLTAVPELLALGSLRWAKALAHPRIGGVHE